MDITPEPTATQRPGPSLVKHDFRRQCSPMRVWLPALSEPSEPDAAPPDPVTEQDERLIAEVEASLRDATRRLREVRCLIDRLGAIPLVGPAD
ncbi:MAG: hypothetical protein KF684_03530 [Phycisphaeraceae bacterium]|nr:hypothetical protein [Phycisphaeraceae bacterium]